MQGNVYVCVLDMQITGNRGEIEAFEVSSYMHRRVDVPKGVAYYMRVPNKLHETSGRGNVSVRPVASANR